jgi:hypothetical protein
VVKAKYSRNNSNIQPFIDQHECVRFYLQRLNANKARAAVFIYLYCEWADKTPEQLLDLKDSFESSEAERLLDRFTIAETDFPDSIRWNMINAVKAFYRANYRQLQSAAGAFDYVVKKSKGAPSKAVRLALFKACYTPRDRALVMASTCTAIARETLSLIRWKHFEEDWLQQDVPCIQIPSALIKGHGKGKYKGVKQVSFLTPEAKRVFREYRDWYSKTFNHVWREDDYVFLIVRAKVRGEVREEHVPLDKDGISSALIRISERAGVDFSSHDGRRIVQTALENHGVSPQWIRKIKGRKVKGEESPYSKPAIEQLRAKYREALPDLQFLSQTDDQATGFSPAEAKFYTIFTKILEKDPEKRRRFQQFLLDL